MLRIRDEGAGIPDEIREKIFDLYFTTKSGGSGIGLAMTYRILQLHHGSVEVQSKPGRGTEFRLANSARRRRMGTPASIAGERGIRERIWGMKLPARSARGCSRCCSRDAFTGLILPRLRPWLRVSQRVHRPAPHP